MVCAIMADQVTLAGGQSGHYYELVVRSYGLEIGRLRGMYDAFAKKCKRAGVEIVDVEHYEKDAADSVLLIRLRMERDGELRLVQNSAIRSMAGWSFLGRSAQWAVFDVPQE